MEPEHHLKVSLEIRDEYSMELCGWVVCLTGGDAEEMCTAYEGDFVEVDVFDIILKMNRRFDPMTGGTLLAGSVFGGGKFSQGGDDPGDCVGNTQAGGEIYRSVEKIWVEHWSAAEDSYYGGHDAEGNS